MSRSLGPVMGWLGRPLVRPDAPLASSPVAVPTSATVQTIEEEPTPAPVPLFEHPEWGETMPWLVQGVTGRGEGGHPFDLALFAADRDGGAVWEGWWRLADAVGMERIAHGRQVHGARVRLHRSAAPGMLLVPGCDGHATTAPGILLAVTVADCVPVFLVDPEGRAVALLHAGWRGVAAGVLRRGVEVLRDRLGVPPGRLLLHVGPAICGECYEVGPEVHRALDLPDPGRPTPVDLRRILTERALDLGLRSESVSVSGHCTRCGGSPFFSHRGGDGERQAAIVGVRRAGEER